METRFSSQTAMVVDLMDKQTLVRLLELEWKLQTDAGTRARFYLMPWEEMNAEACVQRQLDALVSRYEHDDDIQEEQIFPLMSALEAHLALAKLCHIDHQLNKALHLGICLLDVLLANIERAFEGHEEFFNMIQNVVQWILVFMASLTRQEIIDLRSTFSNKILNLALPNGTDLPSSLELLKCCFMPHIDSAHRALSDELEINSDEEQDMGNFMLVEITLAQCADDSQQAQRLIQDNESIACIRELLLIGLRQQRDKAALKTALTRAIADIDNPNDYQNALYVHDWRDELSRL